MAKKLDEIKEALSSSSTPVKMNSTDSIRNQTDTVKDDVNRISESRKSSYQNLENGIVEEYTSDNIFEEAIYSDNKDVSEIIISRQMFQSKALIFRIF